MLDYSGIIKILLRPYLQTIGKVSKLINKTNVILQQRKITDSKTRNAEKNFSVWLI